ncbi:hypothetical protein H8356DRAFT_1089061 [Neocallimastix lanati (nom. inval.)]|uniref:Uncharacterized protein n=1 Tax=Neocallimastix californiae TaxID=1754190 RepID=A0A1Y2AU54_9FUNG|nr:hypothetical protein H8356DRAFT_1089061 [Neocallimastix sp. JGI-2020a]ORY26082.1 hypothetical protein LY90DRAFT_104754 [Neocallimastix californiae]|eukprot:ORY26082.1 hypothetical protein LY90DRAFT_104754 [Neocallimastix californiae]
MKCFTKISLVLLSCFSLTKGAAISNDSSNIDLSSFFANLLDQNQTPATNNVQEVTKVAAVANPNEIDDTYTQDDIRKYTKFLLNFVNTKNEVVQQPTATTTTTTAVAETTSATRVLNEIKDISSELDQIKERRVGEIDELIDIIKNVSQRLDTLEDTVEQSLAKQEAVNADDTKEVDVVESKDQTITPINENDLKYAALFNAFNKKNEEKITSMQENEIELLQEIKELLTNNNKANANVKVDDGKYIVDATEEVKPQAEAENANVAPSSSEETTDTTEKVENPNVISIDHLKKIINKIASGTTNEKQVDEVQRLIKEIQLNEQAESVEQVNEKDPVEDALFKVSSNTVNDEQVEEVRKFIKSIEAKEIVDDNLKKDEVIRKLIYDISANTTNEEQVDQVQNIIEKIQLYNKLDEVQNQQPQQENEQQENEVADEIVKSPEEIHNDLKILLVNLVDNAKTEEEANNIANIFAQIKKHNKIIKENEEKDTDAKNPEEIKNDLNDLLESLVNNAKTDEEADEVANIFTQIEKHDELIKEEEEKTENAKGPEIIHNDFRGLLDNLVNNAKTDEEADEVANIFTQIEKHDEVIKEKEEKDEDAKSPEDIRNDLLSLLENLVSNATTEEEADNVANIFAQIKKHDALIKEKEQQDENAKSPEEISNDLRNLLDNLVSNATTEEEADNVTNIIAQIRKHDELIKEKEEQNENTKSPEEVTNDLKNLLENLINNAKTEDEAADVANIISQIKKHDKLIKEKSDASNYIKVPHVETYMVDLDDGSSNQIYLKENEENVIEAAEIVEEKKNPPVLVVDLEAEIEEEKNRANRKKGLYVLGAFGVIALAGYGYTYRSKAKKLNDEFPFSDSNLPFSNSMNGLVVDKNFLFRKNSIPKPENIINNDAVIRPSQPSWATSMLMDENNKKGLKENSIQMTEDPEQLLDEQLREIENKGKVLVKPNVTSPSTSSSSVVITIEDDKVSTEVNEGQKQKQKQKRDAKVPKLRRSMSHISLDKKIKEDRGDKDSTDKKSRKKRKHLKKARKTKSLCIEKKIVEEKEDELDKEASLNTSFILDAPSLLFNENESIDTTTTEKVNKKGLNLRAEKPKVPKRISSCLPENSDVLPVLNEKDESQFSQEFAKELMDDYNKKFGEMDK